MRYLLLLFSCLFFASLGFAAERTLEISFSFTPPESKTVSSYRLQQDGIQVCDTPLSGVTIDGQISVFDCEFDTTNGVHQYTLLAVYSDETMSPQSPEFQYTIKTQFWGNFNAKGRFRVRATTYIKEPNI